MGLEALSTAEVANLEVGLALGVEAALRVDEDIVGLEVSVGDALAVQVGKSLEELVGHFLDGEVPLGHLDLKQLLQLVLGNLLPQAGLLTAEDVDDLLARLVVVATEALRHVVKHDVQILAMFVPKHRNSELASCLINR